MSRPIAKLPTTSQMPPPNWLGGGIGYQGGPIPISNTMPPPNNQYHQGRPADQRGPIQIANPMPPHHHQPTPVSSQHQPATTQSGQARLMSNPAGSQKRQQIQRKASWLDNYTPMTMSPEHQASTPNSTSAPIVLQLSSPTVFLDSIVISYSGLSSYQTTSANIGARRC